MPGSVRLTVSVLLIVIVTFALAVCELNSPSLGFAPSQQLVRKAIALQVSQTQHQLTQQLRTSPPKFEIAQVALKQLEPFFVDHLPTYHVLGTYSLKIQLPQQQVTQRKNSFDVYLQRQKAGQTWRLLLPQYSGKGAQSNWRSYLIR